MLCASIMDGEQLFLGIKRSQLRGLRDVHHTRRYHVLRDVAFLVKRGCFINLGSGDFSVFIRKRKTLVANVLHSSRFVNVDVAGIGADYAFPGAQHEIDANIVCLCAAHHKMNLRIIAVQVLFYQLRCALAPRVQPVAIVAFVPALLQRLQNGGVAGAVVVVVESNHRTLLFFDLRLSLRQYSYLREVGCRR